MSEEQFQALVDVVVRFVDLAGVVVIAGGILVITIFTASRFIPSVPSETGADAYHTYRRRIGKAILLGLELLVAADIIRTVAVSPTLEGVAVLGLLILIRTLLSFTLEVELYGRWPWQRPRAE